MKTGVCYSGAGGAIGFLAGAGRHVETRININKITGVSSGAIVGAMQSCGRSDQMVDILLTITDNQIAPKRFGRYARRHLSHLLGIGSPVMGLYDNNPLRKMLRDQLFGQKFKIDFSCIAVDVFTGSLAVWNIKEDTQVDSNNVDMIVSQIISSTAIPGAFSPEKINGRYYIDGGVQTHTPIQPTKDLLPDMDHIVIVSTHTDSREPMTQMKSDFDMLPAVMGDLIGKVSEIDFLHFKYKNQLAVAGVDGYKFYPSSIITPKKPLAPTLRFHHEFTRPDILHGFETANKELLA